MGAALTASQQGSLVCSDRSMAKPQSRNHRKRRCAFKCRGLVSYGLRSDHACRVMMKPLVGAVRQIDRRDPRRPQVLVEVMSRPAEPASGPHQPLSRYLRRLAVDLNSIDSPASKPHLFAVGGSDTWLRVYDRRMTSSDGTVQVCPHFLLDARAGVWRGSIKYIALGNDGSTIQNMFSLFLHVAGSGHVLAPGHGSRAGHVRQRHWRGMLSGRGPCAGQLPQQLCLPVLHRWCRPGSCARASKSFCHRR
jgi:hypothetical protein